MSISIKSGVSVYTDVSQPFIKLSANAWSPLKRALVKTSGGWEEVWPSEIVYTHVGRGYNMNMHAAFGYPTSPAKYIFINNGEIGGTADTLGWALISGVFPAGSTVLLINNGRIQGAGGRGATFQHGGSDTPIDQAKTGSNGLLLQTPVTLQNNGIIGGGGGGGGCTGDFVGSSRYNVAGGGGAGIPGGSGGAYIWSYAPANVGGLDAGGGALYGDGHGGALGVAGNTATVRINNDYSMMTIGAPPGIALGNFGFVLGGSTGLTAANIKGKITAGTSSVWGQFASMSGRGQFGDFLYLNISASGPGASITGGWISGGAGISAIQTTGSQWRFNGVGQGGSYEWPLWKAGVFRFYISTGAGTDYVDVYIRVSCAIQAYQGGRSCFVAGSMVIMEDGSLKSIESITVGERVRTATGYAQVTELYLPILGPRKLYAMADGKCVTSGEHSLWSRDPDTKKQWWSTRDLTQWREEAIDGSGPNFNGHEPFDLTDSEGSAWEFATTEGWLNTTWHQVPAPEDTQLYHLLLDTGGSYFVDGYLVSSIADTGGVDWETFEWKLDLP